MQIGNLSRASHKPGGVAGFQLMRVFIVMIFAAAGALIVTLSLENKSTSLEAVAATVGEQNSTSAPHPTDQPEKTAPVRVANVDLSKLEMSYASSTPPVAPEEPIQDNVFAPMPTGASTELATTPEKSSSNDAQPPETQQATTTNPVPSEMTGAVNVANIANNPAPEDERVDLNTASFEHLNTLRGAGPIGRAIIKGRPYASVEDLVKQKVLRRSIYEKVKDQVMVR